VTGRHPDCILVYTLLYKIIPYARFIGAEVITSTMKLNLSHDFTNITNEFGLLINIAPTGSRFPFDLTPGILSKP
jgi:hypothetical protein